MALKDLVVRGPKPPVVKRPSKKRPITNAHKGSSEPQRINDETWYFEEKKGLLIVHEIRTDDGKYVRTDQFLIPWLMVKDSIQRSVPDFYAF